MRLTNISLHFEMLSTNVLKWLNYDTGCISKFYFVVLRFVTLLGLTGFDFIFY